MGIPKNPTTSSDRIWPVQILIFGGQPYCEVWPLLVLASRIDWDCAAFLLLAASAETHIQVGKNASFDRARHSGQISLHHRRVLTL
jgi:hypothetical protein